MGPTQRSSISFLLSFVAIIIFCFNNNLQRSKEGKTPGDLALENDRKDIVSLLSPELTVTANIKATEQSSKEEEKTKTKKTNTVPARDHRMMFTAMAKISLEDLKEEGPKPQLKRASSFNKEKERQVTTDVKGTPYESCCRIGTCNNNIMPSNSKKHYRGTSETQEKA